MKKSLLSLTLSACMLLGMLPGTAWAAAENWLGDISAATSTWDNGGEITSAAELAQFAYNVNNGILAPKGEATRAETAAMLERFLT